MSAAATVWLLIITTSYYDGGSTVVGNFANQSQCEDTLRQITEKSPRIRLYGICVSAEGYSS